MMTIDEYFSAKPGWRYKMLATDLDTDVLNKARAGVYEADMLKDVPKTWMSKYFQKADGNNYKVIDKIRNMIEFKQFNLMSPIPGTQTYDLISCRNVMIYFDAQTRDAVVRRFYDIVEPGGFLFIGHSESISNSGTKFEYIKPAVYRKPL